MSTVDPLYAQWLQSASLTAVVDAEALFERWGKTAQVLERKTTLALRADAQAEAARHLAFFGAPLVQDEHQLMGQFAPYLAQVIRITCPKLGYDGGVDVFVIGAEDNRATGLSRVTVLRRL
jgi:hypothetical protein